MRDLRACLAPPAHRCADRAGSLRIARRREVSRANSSAAQNSRRRVNRPDHAGLLGPTRANRSGQSIAVGLDVQTLALQTLRLFQTVSILRRGTPRVREA